jgi:porin
MAVPLEGSSEESAADEEEHSVEIALAYTADVWSNVSGGIRRGTTYLDNLDLVLDIDAGRAWGVPGLWVHAHALYNNASTFSDRYVGDALVVSNIDTERAVRLFEAWFDWRPPALPSTSLRVGLYDVNSEFDATISRSLLINSSHGIGHEFAQTGENGPSIFPTTSLGARIAWQPHERWLVEAAVLDGVPGDPAHPTRTTIDLSADDGALLVGEITAVPFDRARVSLGHWSYTAEFDDLVATTPDGTPLRRDDNRGTYLNAELFDSAASGETAPHWTAFARAGVANGHVNEFDRYYALGIVFHDALLPKREDALGIAVATTRAGDDFRRAEADAGAATDRYETNIELTWRIPLNDYVVLQPDLQYIVNPGVVAGRSDALAIGLRVEVAASWNNAGR